MTNKIDYSADMSDLSRKVNLAVSLCNANYKDNGSLIKLKNNKAGYISNDKDLRFLCTQLQNLQPIKVKGSRQSKSNMPSDNYSALKNLNNLDDIIIKEADKGSGIVIMDSSYYLSNIESMLNTTTYEEVTDIDCTALVNKVKRFASSFSNILTKEELEAITKQESYFADFYGMPKIHKSETIKLVIEQQSVSEPMGLINCASPADLTFRPIVACQNCPTKNLCVLIDKILRPYVDKVKFRLKDNWEFLRKLPETTYDDGFVVTADITALYTNISTDSGSKAIDHYITLYPNLLPKRFTKKFVIEAFQFCQNNLYFQFKDTVYRQKDGTGMGKIYAPSLADIKQGYDEIFIEEKLKDRLSTEAFTAFISNYARYLDDIWCIWRLEWLNLLPIIAEVMHSIDPKIKYTFETSNTAELNALPYLDVRVIIQNGTVITDLYSKPTDTFNYVPFNSAHPKHVLRNVPYCLARRIRGIVSDGALLELRMSELKKRLKNKKYPTRLIDDAVSRALAMSRADIIDPKTTPASNTNPEEQRQIYCVTTFDPGVKHPRQIITRCVDNFNATRTNEKEKLNINYSFRKNPSLRQSLMFKKLPGSRGVFKCQNNCTLCSKNIFPGEFLTLKNGINLIPNARFECTSRNLVYVIVCRGCNEFYIGETGDMLKNRFTVHRQHMSLDYNDAPVKADPHLRTCGKGNYYVFPFFRPGRSNSSYRRAQESRWIKKLNPSLNRLL